MKKYKGIVIFLNLILLLIIFNNNLYEKEEILSEGKLVLLKLAPVDPRSLMQGDYMRLRYEITNNIDFQNIPKRGFCVIKSNGQNIADKVRFQENATPLHENEIIIKYRTSAYDLNIGAESYFFEEGQAEKYEVAEYGGLMVDDEGNSVLIGLYNKEKELIK